MGKRKHRATSSAKRQDATITSSASAFAAKAAEGRRMVLRMLVQQHQRIAEEC